VGRASATLSVQTPHGPATVELDRPAAGRARSLLVLGHGASGSVDAPDLVAVRDAGLAAGHAVARVTQPYRVQGRRAPAPAGQLDAAWVAAVAAARRRIGKDIPVVVGGRSSGARVAARTAAQTQAIGVLALAFPLHPPGRPESSRAAELDPDRPTLVINGDADPFGVPTPAGRVTVVRRPGERHDLRRDPAGTARIAIEWIETLLDAIHGAAIA
jgi:predicted alpha/beta-hydrolase family hydrolase